LYRIIFLLLCVGCSVKPLHDLDDCGAETDASNISVDVIAERSGQQLRGFILDMLRDLKLSKKKYRLNIKLTYTEIPFAFATDGKAGRVKLTYLADVVLKDKNFNVVFQRPISAYTSGNISNSQGEVLLSMYARNSKTLLKELSFRIIESIKAFLIYEN
jgi:hypothetical protein